MPSDPLPHKDSSELKLVVATPKELLAQQEANSDEWRGTLSREAYLRREELLYNQDLTRKGGLTPWLLVHEPAVGSRRILCGCESINKRMLFAKGGRVSNAVAHGIASVFCPPQYRGRGYAGRMMNEVNQRLRHWQSEESQPIFMSILYSDIGKNFYTIRGWRPFPSSHIDLTVNSAKGKSGIHPPSLQLLSSEDLPSLCDVDETLMRKWLAQNHDSNRTAVALVPDARTMAWHHARERFVANEVYKRSPTDTGAIVGETEGSRVWCYWTRVWTNPNEDTPNTLHILRMVVEGEDKLQSEQRKETDEATISNVAALVSKAMAAAAEWDMKQVQIWNPSTTTIAAVRMLDESCHIQDRESTSIASLLWYGDGSSDDIDWVWNEKYAWC